MYMPQRVSCSNENSIVSCFHVANAFFPFSFALLLLIRLQKIDRKLQVKLLTTPLAVTYASMIRTEVSVHENIWEIQYFQAFKSWFKSRLLAMKSLLVAAFKSLSGPVLIEIATLFCLL